jgi:hypothetical protein
MGADLRLDCDIPDVWTSLGGTLKRDSRIPPALTRTPYYERVLVRSIRTNLTYGVYGVVLRTTVYVRGTEYTYVLRTIHGYAVRGTYATVHGDEPL